MATKVVATATVRAINRKLLPTRAALTLVSQLIHSNHMEVLRDSIMEYHHSNFFVIYRHHRQ